MIDSLLIADSENKKRSKKHECRILTPLKCFPKTYLRFKISSYLFSFFSTSIAAFNSRSCSKMVL